MNLSHLVLSTRTFVEPLALLAWYPDLLGESLDLDVKGIIGREVGHLNWVLSIGKLGNLRSEIRRDGEPQPP